MTKEPTAPPEPPESPRTNIAIDFTNLLTEDEEENTQQVIQPIPATLPLEQQGRPEILSPTPNIINTVRSAIELTVKDLEPSEQCISNKCCEVDFQLSNHTDRNEPHPGLRNDLCDLIPILFQTGFNTNSYPHLEKYLTIAANNTSNGKKPNYSMTHTRQTVFYLPPLHWSAKTWL